MNMKTKPKHGQSVPGTALAAMCYIIKLRVRTISSEKGPGHSAVTLRGAWKHLM